MDDFRAGHRGPGLVFAYIAYELVFRTCIAQYVMCAACKRRHCSVWSSRFVVKRLACPAIFLVRDFHCGCVRLEQGTQ